MVLDNEFANVSNTSNPGGEPIQIAHIASSRTTMGNSLGTEPEIALRSANGWWARLSSYGVISRLLGFLLLGASALKAYSLADASPGGGESSAVWAQVAVLGFELILGLWLVWGKFPLASWAVAAATFAVFAGLNFHAGWTAQPSCGCFGAVRVYPWYTFAADVGILVVLAFRRPGVRPLLEQRLTGLASLAVGLLAVLLAGYLSWFDRDSGPPARAAVDDSPVADSGFRNIAYDLGVLSPGTSVERVVTIPNESSRPCSAKSVWSDCSCVVHELTPAVAEPGANWDLKFRYKAHVHPGGIAQRIVIRFNEDGVDPVIVWIRGTVRDWAEPSPDEVTFPGVSAGGVVEKDLTVSTLGADESFVGNPSMTGVPWLTVRQLGTDASVSDGVEGRLHRFRLRFAPPRDAQAAVHNGELVLAPASGRHTALRIPCQTRVLPRLSASADEVFLGFVRAGNATESTVRVRLYDPNLPAKPSEWTVRHDLGVEFTATLTEADSPGEFLLHIKVSRTADSRPGIHKGTLTIAAGNETNLSLPVQACLE